VIGSARAFGDMGGEPANTIRLDKMRPEQIQHRPLIIREVSGGSIYGNACHRKLVHRHEHHLVGQLFGRKTELYLGAMPLPECSEIRYFCRRFCPMGKKGLQSRQLVQMPIEHVEIGRLGRRRIGNSLLILAMCIFGIANKITGKKSTNHSKKVRRKICA
jgi:hypothetical protein